MLRFECPAVRIRRRTDLVKGTDTWARIGEGVNYVGKCHNMNCIARKGQVSIEMHFGTHRPNEVYNFGQIYCPACRQPFKPDRFIFKMCSAKIDFCIKGERPDSLLLSESEPMKARKFGQAGLMAVYTHLIIQVDEPGVHPNCDELDSLPMYRKSLLQRKASKLLSSDSFGSLATRLTTDSVQGGMDPEEILYIQDSIANRFQCGRKVVDTMKGLRHGALNVFTDIPPIRVFEWRGQVHTEDNR
ncbi:unnamed protein product [Polarella glacialis]|uniref:Uncharacterized protein n=1 Tax=Polarella glacialis TaxID=89957 RepID=A0A813DBD6_POLGL|nr:unnamed protein product [Polarella glacialis]